jgi:signal transduction histidine kinase
VRDSGHASGGYASSGTPGRGLVGLRERLSLYGGELDAGLRPGGGWQVRAVIPVELAA